MCQQVLQFCSSSAKPLVLVGALLTLLLAASIGYAGHSTNSLYQDIDPRVASSHSLAYHLQLVAAAYLSLVTVFGCVAVHYDHKQMIRVLAILSSVNLILAAAAILLLPSDQQVAGLFAPRLKEAQALYDFTDKFPALNDSRAEAKQRPARMVLQNASAVAADSHQEAPVGDLEQRALGGAKADEPMTKETATGLWDKLQLRGCCGIQSYTEWKSDSIPKSCCGDAGRLVEGDRVRCKSVDADHEKACAFVIESSSCHLMLLLALVAMVSLYLAIVAGIETYRTFHYDEASQNAYT